MIKLFRHIRHSMIIKGKSSRYLKYAIGEIILVVIGILIALQINNWNQNIQTAKNNKSYLTKMLKDLDFINMRLNSIVYNYSNDNNFGYPSLEEAQSDCDSILQLTYLGLKKEHFNYIHKAKYFQGNSLLNIYDNTYQELLNTGKLYSLGSDHLINAIQNYYKMCERETKYHIANTGEIDKGKEMFEHGFTKIFMDYRLKPDRFNLENYPFYFKTDSKDYKNFQLGVYKIYEAQNANMSKMKYIIKETDFLKSIIKKELK